MADIDLTLEQFDPFAPAHLSEPAAGWALLRRPAPVYRQHMPSPVPVFMVTAKRDIEEIARQTNIVSSNPVPSVWRWGAFEPKIAAVFDRGGYKVVYTLPPPGRMTRCSPPSELRPRPQEQARPHHLRRRHPPLRRQFSGPRGAEHRRRQLAAGICIG
jgi:hypothetical protein